jgi:hypothetical protein
MVEAYTMGIKRGLVRKHFVVIEQVYQAVVGFEILFF